MSKIAKSNTPTKKMSKKVEGLRDDIFFFKKVPVSDRYLSELARDLVQWAQHDEEAIKLEQFLCLRCIQRKVWDDWLFRSEELQEAAEFAKMLLGTRREVAGLKRQLDPGIVAFTMPTYDPAWKELLAWKASLQDKDRNQQAQNFIIQMPSFGDMNAISNDNDKAEQVQTKAVSDRCPERSGE